MPRNVPFAEPSTYIRYVGPVVGESRDQSFRDEGQSTLRFIRLNSSEGPVKLPFTYPAIAAGGRSQSQSFSDLVSNYNHIQQVFMGVSYGARARVFLPVDERIIKLDEGALQQTTDNDAGQIDYEDSPIDNPRFHFWVAPGKNFVPSIDMQNILSDVQPPRTIDLQVLFYLMKFTFDLVDRQSEPDVYDKLAKFSIPSTHITFGGRI